MNSLLRNVKTINLPTIKYLSKQATPSLSTIENHAPPKAEESTTFSNSPRSRSLPPNLSPIKIDHCIPTSFYPKTVSALYEPKFRKTSSSGLCKPTFKVAYKFKRAFSQKSASRAKNRSQDSEKRSKKQGVKDQFCETPVLKPESSFKKKQRQILQDQNVITTSKTRSMHAVRASLSTPQVDNQVQSMSTFKEIYKVSPIRALISLNDEVKTRKYKTNLLATQGKNKVKFHYLSENHECRQCLSRNRKRMADFYKNNRDKMNNFLPKKRGYCTYVKDPNAQRRFLEEQSENHQEIVLVKDQNLDSSMEEQAVTLFNLIKLQTTSPKRNFVPTNSYKFEAKKTPETYKFEPEKRDDNHPDPYPLEMFQDDYLPELNKKHQSCPILETTTTEDTPVSEECQAPDPVIEKRKPLLLKKPEMRLKPKPITTINCGKKKCPDCGTGKKRAPCKIPVPKKKQDDPCAPPEKKPPCQKDNPCNNPYKGLSPPPQPPKTVVNFPVIKLKDFEGPENVLTQNVTTYPVGVNWKSHENEVPAEPKRYQIRDSNIHHEKSKVDSSKYLEIFKARQERSRDLLQLSKRTEQHKDVYFIHPKDNLNQKICDAINTAPKVELAEHSKQMIARAIKKMIDPIIEKEFLKYEEVKAALERMEKHLTKTLNAIKPLNQKLAPEAPAKVHFKFPWQSPQIKETNQRPRITDPQSQLSSLQDPNFKIPIAAPSWAKNNYREQQNVFNIFATDRPNYLGQKTSILAKGSGSGCDDKTDEMFKKGKKIDPADSLTSKQEKHIASKKEDQCKKEDPCKPKDPCKKEDPCKPKDPCKKEDPCKPKDPCKKEDPCKKDPCKAEPVTKCDPCIKPETVCKIDPCGKEEETPCGPPEKASPIVCNKPKCDNQDSSSNSVDPKGGEIACKKSPVQETYDPCKPKVICDESAIPRKEISCPKCPDGPMVKMRAFSEEKPDCCPVKPDCGPKCPEVTEAECIQIPCKECKPEEEIKPKPVICIKSSQDGLHGLPGMKQMAKCDLTKNPPCPSCQPQPSETFLDIHKSGISPSSQPSATDKPIKEQPKEEEEVACPIVCKKDECLNRTQCNKDNRYCDPDILKKQEAERKELAELEEAIKREQKVVCRKPVMFKEETRRKWSAVKIESNKMGDKNTFKKPPKKCSSNYNSSEGSKFLMSKTSRMDMQLITPSKKSLVESCSDKITDLCMMIIRKHKGGEKSAPIVVTLSRSLPSFGKIENYSGISIQTSERHKPFDLAPIYFRTSSVGGKVLKEKESFLDMKECFVKIKDKQDRSMFDRRLKSEHDVTYLGREKHSLSDSADDLYNCVKRNTKKSSKKVQCKPADKDSCKDNKDSKIKQLTDCLKTKKSKEAVAKQRDDTDHCQKKKKDSVDCSKKEDPCKKKEDPCKLKEDSCKKSVEGISAKGQKICEALGAKASKETFTKPLIFMKKFEDDKSGCKTDKIECKGKDDPCKKKEDPCKKKEDPCKKKEDPCKKKEDPCKKKEDPCKKKEDPCKKKEDPCKKKEDPCKKKEDPCKKKEDPCKKKEDPCKKKEDPCKKKEDPCKKKCDNKPEKTGKFADCAAILSGQKPKDCKNAMNKPINKSCKKKTFKDKYPWSLLQKAKECLLPSSSNQKSTSDPCLTKKTDTKTPTKSKSDPCLSAKEKNESPEVKRLLEKFKKECDSSKTQTKKEPEIFCKKDNLCNAVKKSKEGNKPDVACKPKDPCKKEDPCKKKKEDPCKKPDPCKKKEDPCKKPDPCKTSTKPTNKLQMSSSVQGSKTAKGKSSYPWNMM